MSSSGNPFRTLAYLIVGILVLIVTVQVVGVVLQLVATLVAALLSIALLIVLGYFIYLLVKAAAGSTDSR